MNFYQIFWTLKICHGNRRRARYKQATAVGLLFIVFGDDGRRGQVLSIYNRFLLITHDIQLCIQRDG